MSQANLFPARFRETQFELHEHTFLGSNRSPLPKIRHSHMGGSVPHEHPGYGPSYYGHGKREFSAQPKGDQLSYVARTEEQNSFELVITDSAKPMPVLDKKSGKYVSPDISTLGIENISMPAAERLVGGSRLKCIVRDERTKRA